MNDRDIVEYLYQEKNKTFIFKNKDMFNKESFTLNGENLLKKVKELIAEGNIRKITITDKSGKELMSFPLNVGLVGALLAPVLAAVGALAALIGECTITVDREEPKEKEEEKKVY